MTPPTGGTMPPYRPADDVEPAYLSDGGVMLTPDPDAARRGRSNRRQGHDAERALAKWLRVNGWPTAARKADNGWRAGETVSADHGDIKGTPGIVWQVKHVAKPNVARWLAETVEQTIAAEADFGVLVQRRDGKADPGRWWAWLTVADLARLLAVGEVLTAAPRAALVAPVCLEVRAVVELLRAAGYGDDPHNPTAARLEVRAAAALLRANGYGQPPDAPPSSTPPRPAPTTHRSAESD